MTGDGDSDSQKSRYGTEKVSMGIDGLDTLLHGGLVPGTNALVRGPPGSGKTIFGLYFLSEGTATGRKSLFVNLGEPTDYVQATATGFGLDSDSLEFRDLSPGQDQFASEERYSLFKSAEVEGPGFISELRETIEDIDPDRVLLDPITEYRHLTTDEHQFRKHILGLLDLLKSSDITVVLTSQASDSVPDEDLQFLTDTVINLESTSGGRQVTVSKFRGSSFREGPHQYEITDAGIEVWPTLQAGTGGAEIDSDTLSSGVPELDELLNGGLEHGTVTFLSGPTGVGKTTTGVQFLKEAASRGTPAILFEFEESRRTLLERSDAVNIPLREMIDTGNLSLIEIPPDAYAADQFGDMVRSAVDEGIELVMIDGVQGFKQNLRGLDPTPTQTLLRVGRYLRSNGVSTIFTNEMHTITGEFRVTEEGLSNLADNVVFLRHVEYEGEMRKVIGALKMRTSDFEHSLRALEITGHGLKVGDPLPHLRGILTGTPEWNGGAGIPTNQDSD